MAQPPSPPHDPPGKDPSGDPPDGEADQPDDLRLREWQEVFQGCQSGLASFLRGRLAQQVDVDDCLQSVCMKMIRQAGKPADDVAPSARRAWLFRVAANEAAAIWRRKASTEKMMKRQGSNDVVADFQAQLIETETSIQIRAAIDSLPAPLRDVLRLRIDENLTFQQIADRLNIPLGTALTRMRRALNRLRNEFQSKDNQ